MNSMTLSDFQPILRNFVSALPAAVIVIIGAIAFNFVVKRGLKILANRTRLRDGDIAPLAKVAGWFIFVATIVLLLGVFGADLGGIWTMVTGVGALVAIGFIAVWSVLSNWMATFLLLLTRPFSVGDDVEFVGESVKGRVADLNFMYTTLRADDGSTIQVPNNLFFQKSLRRRRGSSTVSLAEQLQSSNPETA